MVPETMVGWSATSRYLAMSPFQNSYTRPEVWVARWRTVALVLGGRNLGWSPSYPTRTCRSPNSGKMSSTNASGSSWPRSTRIMAAVEPTALVMEKIRKTVSSVAGAPGARSPAAPDQSAPSELPNMATTKGTSLALTASFRIADMFSI